MKAIEAYQRIVLAKGLADILNYDEFAVWWASKGVTRFYKEKEDMIRRVNKLDRGWTVSNQKELDEFTQDVYQDVMDAINNSIEPSERFFRFLIQMIGRGAQYYIRNQRDQIIQRLETLARSTRAGLTILGIVYVVSGVIAGALVTLSGRNTSPLRSPRRVIQDRYTFIPRWEHPIDLQQQWRVYDLWVFYNIFLETGVWDHSILTPEDVEEYLQQHLFLLVSGGGGYGGGHWM
jgi:hypothetical protein